MTYWGIMPVFWIFWRESFGARKQRLAARGSRLGLAGSQNSLPLYVVQLLFWLSTIAQEANKVLQGGVSLPFIGSLRV